MKKYAKMEVQVLIPDGEDPDKFASELRESIYLAAIAFHSRELESCERLSGRGGALARAYHGYWLRLLEGDIEDEAEDGSLTCGVLERVSTSNRSTITED